MRNILLSLVIVLASQIGFTQYDHQSVFPNLDGSELLDAMVEEYKPNITLSYGEARDIIYTIVDNVNDTVSCIYSGHEIYLPPNTQNPREFLLMGGDNNGINAEHSYPQSMGAGNGAPRSDMHHIFPARVLVNGDRGSLPYAEIADNITDFWYKNNIRTTNIPSTDIDAYSEKVDGFFEPREEVKGDIARAIMYFFTMYNQQANSANANFFPSQVEVLCDWHYADPVDQKEWERSQEIANYQSNKANPFVLDCSAAGRSYCDFISNECRLSDTEDLTSAGAWKVYPVPLQGDVLKLEFNQSMKPSKLRLISLMGQTLISKNLDESEVFGVLEIDLYDIPSGSYFVQLVIDNEISTKKIIK